METSAPLINAVVNNAVPLQLTYQSDSASNHPHPAFFSGRLAAPYFKINVLRSWLFGGQKSGSSTGLLHYCTFGLEAANDAQDARADTARGKDNDQQNISKMIM